MLLDCEDAIVMDVKSIPKTERRVHAAKQNSMSSISDQPQKTNGNWKEQSFDACEKPPHQSNLDCCVEESQEHWSRC